MRALGVALLCAMMLRAQPVRVRIDGATVELARERYVAGVLGGESSVFRSDEALKAMAVAARTYAVRMRGRHSADGYDFCATTHCQRVDLDAITARIEGIVAATAGELLWKEGKPALTLYSLDCGGASDRNHPPLQWWWPGDAARIVNALARSQLQAPRDLRSIAIAQRDEAGRAVTLALTGGSTVRISAESFRLAIGRDLGWNTIRSDLYEVRGLTFQGRGAGHGAGLCQRGAEQMGADGRSYREILAAYYPGTSLGVTARGILWQRMCGSAVCLQSANPQQDREVLATAERLAPRLPWPLPAGVEIRVYPDVDTFRNATGEPGWVAAFTTGRRIHLQPAAALQHHDALGLTVKHELLHVAVESQAKPDLPLWFREGLVIYLGGGVHGTVGRPPAGTEVRRTDDATAARRAYEQASRAVAGLVQRYGKETVFDWVKRGLPPEVTRANANQPATNSR